MFSLMEWSRFLEQLSRKRLTKLTDPLFFLILALGVLLDGVQDEVGVFDLPDGMGQLLPGLHRNDMLLYQKLGKRQHKQKLGS